MSSDLRKYLDLLDSINHQDVDVQEADYTDEIEFGDSDSFDEVIEKVMQDERNRIGYGDYRQTWHHPFDKRLVIKVAKPSESKDYSVNDSRLRNTWEYLVWHLASSQDLPEKKFLMPCVDSHPDGDWLTMFKGERLPEDKPVSTKDKTDWIGDRKKDNYRILDGKTLAVDYGSQTAAEHFDIPTEEKPAFRMLRKALHKQDKPVNNPDYGKSTPHPDPES